MLRYYHSHFFRKKINGHFNYHASSPSFLQCRHKYTSQSTSSSSSPPPLPTQSVPNMTLYNSLTSTHLPLLSPSPPSSQQQQQQHPPPIAWYTCGPTVYDSTHLGHARTYTLLDIIHRLLHHHTPPSSPTPPLFVMNITDVDDKILSRAARLSLPPLALARHYETIFWNDMDRLNVKRPHVVARVSEHVATSIVPHIEDIEKRGMAYMLEDGLYFDVGAFEGTRRVYGRLMMAAGGSARENGGEFWSWEKKETEERSNDDDDDDDDDDDAMTKRRRKKKRDIRDFALWKKCSPSDNLYWSSPWGDGRPGWHVECSAIIEHISQHYLPSSYYNGITVHAGGIDLKFPHHVNEMAQAEASSGKSDWIGHWVHTGHLTIRGRKMSKSEKNFISVEEYWTRQMEESDSPGDDWRLWCLALSGSYRGGAAFSWERLREARIIRQKIVQFMIDAQHLIDQEEQPEHLSSPDDISNTTSTTTVRSWSEEEHHIFRYTHCTIQQCHEALNNDLDGKTFLKHLLDLINFVKPHLQQQFQQQQSSSSSSPKPSSSVYNALTYTLSSIRDLLETLGFSETTYRAGLLLSSVPHHRRLLPTETTTMTSTADDDRHNNTYETNINTTMMTTMMTTTTTCLNAFVNFRAHVRHKALMLKDDDILKMCDDVRDEMAVHGVEIMDGAAATAAMAMDVSSSTTHENDDVVSSAVAARAASLWRPCVPKTKKHTTTTTTTKTTKAMQGDNDMSTVKGSNITKKSTANDTTTTAQIRITNVPVQDLFKVGQYKGQFSSYDNEGIPLVNANGDEVSKSMRKRLLKKREKYVKKKNKGL